MFNDFSELILVVIGGLLSIYIVSDLIDVYFKVIGSRAYFTRGVVMFSKHIPVNHHYSNTPQQIILEKEFHSRLISSFIFTEIDPFSYGFHQEKFVFFKWLRIPDVMHGLLIFDTQNNKVVVKGFANYSTLIMYFAWLIMTILKILQDESLTTPSPLLVRLAPIAVLIFFLWFMYLMQSARFEKVALFAAQSWERKHMRDKNEA